MPAEVIDDSNSVVDVTGAGAGHDVFLQRRFPTVPNLPLPQQMPSSEHHRQEGPPQKRDGLTDELVHSDRRPDRRGQPQQPRRDTQPPSRPRGEQCGRTCEKGETGDGSRQFRNRSTAAPIGASSTSGPVVTGAYGQLAISRHEEPRISFHHPGTLLWALQRRHKYAGSRYSGRSAAMAAG